MLLKRMTSGIGFAKIHGDFYRQRCNVNVTGLSLQFEQIELSEV